MNKLARHVATDELAADLTTPLNLLAGESRFMWRMSRGVQARLGGGLREVTWPGHRWRLHTSLSQQQTSSRVGSADCAASGPVVTRGAALAVARRPVTW